MPKVLFFAASRSCSVDRFTNQLSLFEILEGFVAPNYPLLMPLVVVAVITKSAGDQKDSYLFELKFQMGDNTLFSQTAETNFEKSDRVRSINFVQGLPIPEPGALRIALLHANKVAADYTIDFRCTQASPSPSETKLGKRKPNKRHATQKKARVRLAKA